MGEFAGMMIVVDENMPADEFWLMQDGQKKTLHVHEGPQAGQDVEVWLREPRILRVFNLGDMYRLSAPKTYFDKPGPEQKVTNG